MQEQPQKNINLSLAGFGFEELPPRWVKENQQKNIHTGLSICLGFQELSPRWEVEPKEEWAAALPSPEEQIKNCLSKPIEGELRKKLLAMLASLSTIEPPSPEEIVAIASDRQIYREDDIRKIIYSPSNQGAAGFFPSSPLLFHAGTPLLIPHYAFQKLLVLFAQETLTVGDLIPLISCPITQQIFQTPVVAMNGWTHEASVLHALSEQENSSIISTDLNHPRTLKGLGLSDEEIRSLRDSGRFHYPLCIQTPQIKALVELLLENFPALKALQFPKDIPIYDINVSAIEHYSLPSPTLARDDRSYVKPVLLSLGNLGLILFNSFLISECNRIVYSDPRANTFAARAISSREQLTPLNACKQAFEILAQKIYPAYFGIAPIKSILFQSIARMLSNFLPPSPRDAGPLLLDCLLFICLPIYHMPHAFFNGDRSFGGKHCDTILSEAGYPSENIELLTSYHSMASKWVLLGAIGGISLANILLSRWSSRLFFPKKHPRDKVIEHLQKPQAQPLYKKAESKSILFAHKHPNSKIADAIGAHLKYHT